MERYARRVAVPEFSNNAVNAQETQLFRKFAELVLSGKQDPWWAEIALKTQKVLDAAPPFRPTRRYRREAIVAGKVAVRSANRTP